LQVIEIYSHQLLKNKWIDFSSKQRSFYFTKSSRGPDPTTQRAGFGPRAVCLTPLRSNRDRKSTVCQHLPVSSHLSSTQRRMARRNLFWERSNSCLS